MKRYRSSTTPPVTRPQSALWFAFESGKLLVVRGPNETLLPSCGDLAELGLAYSRSLYLGTLDDVHCYASDLRQSDSLPPGHEMQALRSVYDLVDESLSTLAGRAYQLMEWDRNHQYCSRCGAPAEPGTGEHARSCSRCKLRVYPPVSPAIMVLITHGRRLLLAHKHGSPPGRFSSIAGFVEPGETLEDTARRETFEEIGVEIDNIRYFGSQPWPFPHSLMVAFVADYAGGEIKPDGVEIEEARFFDIAELPKLPPSTSISRRMINTVTAKLARGERF